MQQLTCSGLLLGAMKLAVRIVGEENMSCTAASSSFNSFVGKARVGLEVTFGSLPISFSVIEMKYPASTGKSARDARVENCRFMREEFPPFCIPIAKDCSPLQVMHS